MTIEEFDNTDWIGGAQVFFEGKTYDVISVDFQERLVGIDEDLGDDEISWKRCENVTLCK